jgi:hypothetical protein
MQRHFNSLAANCSKPFSKLTEKNNNSKQKITCSYQTSYYSCTAPTNPALCATCHVQTAQRASNDQKDALWQHAMLQQHHAVAPSP